MCSLWFTQYSVNYSVGGLEIPSSMIIQKFAFSVGFFPYSGVSVLAVLAIMATPSLLFSGHSVLAVLAKVDTQG